MVLGMPSIVPCPGADRMLPLHALRALRNHPQLLLGQEPRTATEWCCPQRGNDPKYQIGNTVIGQDYGPLDFI
jgi:hypothetical protein